MTRRLVILLVCWPLLLPQGLCVCRLAASAPARADRVATPKRSCACCRDKGDAEKTCPIDVAPKPASPTPTEHPPWCPASPSWESARTSLHAAEDAEAVAPLADVVAVCPPEAVVVRPVRVPESDPHLPPAPPLYSCNFRC